MSVTAPTARTGGVRQSSAKASALSITGAVITMAATFGLVKLVSLDGSERAGIFFTATALVSILGTMSALGTPTSLVYFMPRELRGDQPNPARLIRTALGPVLCVAGLVAVALFVLSGPLGTLLGGNRPDELTTMLRVLAPAVPAWSVGNTLLGATRGLGTVSATVGVQQILRPTTQVALMGLAVATTSSSAAIALAWGLPVVVGASVAAIVAGRLGGFARNDGHEVESAEFWRYARPHSITNGLQIAVERVDVIIVAAVLGAAPAGVYGGLSRFATAANFMVFAVAQAVSPNLRRSINDGRLDDAARLLRTAAGWMVLITWPYLLIVAIKAPTLAGILSADFVAQSNLLVLLTLGIMISAASGPIELNLLMRGHSTSALATTAMSLAIDVGLVVLLARPFGIYGAAAAWAISVASKNIVDSYLSHRWHGVVGYGRPAALAGVGALLATIPVGLLSPQRFSGLTVTVAVAGVGMLGWVWFNRSRFVPQEHRVPSPI